MQNKQITIYDIARRLGLSAATVSRALTNNSATTQKTRQKVLELAAELGYQRNKFASNLRNQRTNTIGVIVPRLNSPFISSVLSGIEKLVNGEGYNLIISQSFEEESRERDSLQTMFENSVDALIVSLCNHSGDFSHFDGFLKREIPVVLFDRVTSKIPSTRVTIDNFMAGQVATEHLIDQGFKRIVHVTGDLGHSVYSQRFEGYKMALQKNRLPFVNDMLISTEFDEASIRQVIIGDVLGRDDRPDALFFANDSCAAIALSVLRDMGIGLPAEMGIVGFNNDLISRVTQPQITSIDYPGFEMGETIGKIIVQKLRGGKLRQVNREVVLDAELLVRPSSLRKAQLINR